MNALPPVGISGPEPALTQIMAYIDSGAIETLSVSLIAVGAIFATSLWVLRTVKHVSDSRQLGPWMRSNDHA